VSEDRTIDWEAVFRVLVSEDRTENVLWPSGPNWASLEADPRCTVTHFKPQPWPERSRPGEWQRLHCMMYAERLACQHLELTKVEGYAQGPGGRWGVARLVRECRGQRGRSLKARRGHRVRGHRHHRLISASASPRPRLNTVRALVVARRLREAPRG
jgi:hypothetical protein